MYKIGRTKFTKFAKLKKNYFLKVNRDYGGTEDFFVDIAVELVLERRSLLDRKVLLTISESGQIFLASQYAQEVMLVSQ